MDNSQMAGIAQRYVEIVSSHDIEAMCGLFARDAYQEDPVGHEPHIGIDAIREFFQAGFSHIAKAELTGSIHCAGNTVAFPLAVIIDAGGSQLRLDAIDVFEFNEEGNIQTMKAYWGPENCSEV